MLCLAISAPADWQEASVPDPHKTEQRKELTGAMVSRGLIENLLTGHHAVSIMLFVVLTNPGEMWETHTSSAFLIPAQGTLHPLFFSSDCFPQTGLPRAECGSESQQNSSQAVETSQILSAAFEIETP